MGLGPGYCSETVVLNYMGFRPDGSTTYTRNDAPLYGSFFGQSTFARHAIASADNLVVVDKSLDLARLGPYGCAFQRSEEHTSELQSLMRISYAVFCLNKKKTHYISLHI